MRQFISDLSSRAANRRDHWVSRARRRAYLTRVDGAERLLELRLQGLQTTRNLVEKVPYSGKISELIESRIDAVLATEIEDFDELTAKDLIKLVRDIEDPARLQRIFVAEESGKERKTVLGAVEKQLERLAPEVVEIADPEPEAAPA